MGTGSQSNSAATRKLVIVDAANTVYRAFFAIPSLRAPDGLPTNAILGFANMLAKVIREERPDYIAVAFDPPGKTFRHALFSGYKATRDAQPEDLSVQLPVIRELCDAHQVPVLEIPDFEADDVIATLVEEAPREVRVTIVSTDKDLMQLVSERVELLDTMKDRRFGPEEVTERFGVPPEKLLDFRALVGDASDNIPGVKGIGEKGAAKLIREWGDLESLLEHVSDVKAKRAREALESHAEEARLSKRLSVLRSDAPIGIDIESIAWREPDVPRVRALYERLGFARLIESLGVGAEDPEARPVQSGVDTTVVSDASSLQVLAAKLEALERIPLAVVADREDPIDAEVAGLAVALSRSEAAYVPARSTRNAPGEGLEIAKLLDALRPALETHGRPWLGRDVKGVMSILAERGLEVAPACFDVMLAAFLLDPSGAHATPTLARTFLNREVRSWEDLAGRGAKATAAVDLPVARVAEWAGAEVCAIAELAPILLARLEADGLLPLFEEVEMPLAAVLARAERAGVRVDESMLGALSQEYESELARIEAEIFTSAGEKFLISSPKQLQRILFEKLRLPVIKKTKTGYSTDEGVLEQLAVHHELPAQILAYRRLAKLKSTYIDALPPLVNGRTGRIHPTFNQMGAATGRLSAANPNVQNIPIRTAEGVRIREAFIAAEGKRLLSADYSQFELRILAHFSEDQNLIEAFRAGDDIHRRTASEVLGIPQDAVTAEQRARAKAINFGIIYGSSAFGIANQLGIATGEAQATIDAYFERYRGVRRFLDRTIAEARERGFVRTLLGRRRYLPDLGSRNRVLRNAAERMAVNTVIQGTEADLIKKAMVDVDRRLREQSLDTCMILQVHDELVFEAPESEVDRVAQLLREWMQGVALLRVPLVVDLGVGRNWREAH
jgi:DNA polymerase-1